MKNLINITLLILTCLSVSSCYKRPCDAYSQQEKNENMGTFTHP